MTMEGKKFSSSRGIVIYVRDILSRYQVDAVRYYISVAGPEKQDADFTWAEFVRHNNEELVAGWGNLVNRIANLIYKNFGCIPEVKEDDFTAEDQTLLDTTLQGFDNVGNDLEHQNQHAAVTEIMRLVGLINKYISEMEPWKITNQQRLATVLFTAAQAVNDIDIMFAPFLPHSSQKIHDIMGGKGMIAPLPHLEEVTDLDDSQFQYPIITGTYRLNETVAPWKRELITPGAVIEKPSPVFTKIPREAVQEEIDRFKADMKQKKEAEKARRIAAKKAAQN